MALAARNPPLNFMINPKDVVGLKIFFILTNIIYFIRLTITIIQRATSARIAIGCPSSAARIASTSSGATYAFY